jgi:hypothetical protein
MYNVSRPAFDKVFIDLGQKIDSVTSELKIVSESVTNTNGNHSASSCGPSNASGSSFFTILAKSKLLPRLEHALFNNIVHWHPHDYRKLRRTTRTSKKTGLDELDESGAESGSNEPKKKDTATLSCFLKDRNGDPISETEKKAILSMASGFWQYLQENDRAPKSFRKANLEIKLQWQMLMESNFECLRYCDSHWKVDQIWINHYPSWLKTNVWDRAKANNVSDEAVIDVDAENDEDVSGT